MRKWGESSGLRTAAQVLHVCRVEARRVIVHALLKRRGCVWAAPTGEVELPAAPLPTVPCAVRCRRDGLPHLAPRALAEAPAAPVPTLFWAPQFSFSRAEALMVEAPFCAHLPHLARGDEMLMSCRLWAAGWDFFAPNETLAYHLWDAEYRPSLEREAFMAEDGELSLIHI